MTELFHVPFLNQLGLLDQCTIFWSNLPTSTPAGKRVDVAAWYVQLFQSSYTTGDGSLTETKRLELFACYIKWWVSVLTQGKTEDTTLFKTQIISIDSSIGEFMLSDTTSTTLGFHLEYALLHYLCEALAYTNQSKPTNITWQRVLDATAVAEQVFAHSPSAAPSFTQVLYHLLLARLWQQRLLVDPGQQVKEQWIRTHLFRITLSTTKKVSPLPRNNRVAFYWFHWHTTFALRILQTLQQSPNTKPKKTSPVKKRSPLLETGDHSLLESDKEDEEYDLTKQMQSTSIDEKKRKNKPSFLPYVRHLTPLILQPSSTMGGSSSRGVQGVSYAWRSRNLKERAARVATLFDEKEPSITAVQWEYLFSHLISPHKNRDRMNLLEAPTFLDLQSLLSLQSMPGLESRCLMYLMSNQAIHHVLTSPLLHQPQTLVYLQTEVPSVDTSVSAVTEAFSQVDTQYARALHLLINFQLDQSLSCMVQEGLSLMAECASQCAWYHALALLRVVNMACQLRSVRSDSKWRGEPHMDKSVCTIAFHVLYRQVTKEAGMGTYAVLFAPRIPSSLFILSQAAANAIQVSLAREWLWLMNESLISCVSPLEKSHELASHGFLLPLRGKGATEKQRALIENQDKKLAAEIQVWVQTKYDPLQECKDRQMACYPPFIKLNAITRALHVELRHALLGPLATLTAFGSSAFTTTQGGSDLSF